MSRPATAALTAVGVLVLLLGLRDMFHTLLHPTGQGRLTGWVLSACWRLSRATGHRAGSAVGPGAMVVVVLLWVALQVTGWALVYLPHVPQGFAYGAGVDPSDYSTVLEAGYVSAVTLTTLGYGDVIPTDPWVRAVSPLEALTGFALLTGGLTWFSQIYPPLSRRRALALELKALADADAEGLGGLDGDPAVVTRVLDRVTTAASQVRIDFVHHAEGFYFQESEPDLSLAHQAGHLLRLRDAALGSPDPSVRRSGRRLSLAVDQLSKVLDDNLLHVGGEPAEVLAAYAREHGHDARVARPR